MAEAEIERDFYHTRHAIAGKLFSVVVLPNALSISFCSWHYFDLLARLETFSSTLRANPEIDLTRSPRIITSSLDYWVANPYQTHIQVDTH